jgi:hypothetical protein
VDEQHYVTVVETRQFIIDAKLCFSDEERMSFINYIASNPTTGVIIPGTGGIRKIRWGASGRGKRGGARVIYYYHDDRIPLFLLTAYVKAHKTDLSPAEKTAMKRLGAEIVATYPPRSRTEK